MPFAVITGATQGIGLAIAEKLLEEGFSIATCARSATDLQALQARWQQQYPQARNLLVQADLSERQAVAAFAAQVLAHEPRVDILVNNAGLFFPGKLAEEPEGQLETLMAINLYSAYHLTRALLPGMQERRSGHIFNICSVASLKAYPNGGAYSITKYALLGFSENLRAELMPYHIRVTAISPGATASRSWAGSGVAPERIMEARDVATMLWAAYNLSAQANVEQVVMRPLLGDL